MATATVVGWAGLAPGAVFAPGAGPSFFDSPDKCDLLRLDVGNVKLISSLSGHAVPKPFPSQRQLDAVLGKSAGFGKKLRVHFVSYHCIHVSIDVFLQAGAVTGDLDGRLSENRRCNRAKKIETTTKNLIRIVLPPL